MSNIFVNMNTYFIYFIANLLFKITNYYSIVANNLQYFVYPLSKFKKKNPKHLRFILVLFYIIFI